MGLRGFSNLHMAALVIWALSSLLFKIYFPVKLSNKTVGIGIIQIDFKQKTVKTFFLVGNLKKISTYIQIETSHNLKNRRFEAFCVGDPKIKNLIFRSRGQILKNEKSLSRYFTINIYLYHWAIKHFKNLLKYLF